MGFLWWGKQKEESEGIREEVQRAFSKVKDDFKKTGEWINHLHTRDAHHEHGLNELNERLSYLEQEMGEIRHFLSFFGPGVFKQLSKQPSTAVDKQTAVEAVQTGVQTAVENGFLRHLSTMERAIVWVLLNTELKMSYEDVAAVLGKERSTIRGQINSIRQKSEGLIEEVTERNGKKRIYVPEHMKNLLLKSVKLSQKGKNRAAKG